MGVGGTIFEAQLPYSQKEHNYYRCTYDDFPSNFRITEKKPYVQVIHDLP